MLLFGLANSVGAQVQLVTEASVILIADVGIGQQLLLGTVEPRQGRRQQRAIERLVEVGAGVLVDELLGLRVEAERDDYGVPIRAAAGLEQLVQGDGEQPAGELPLVGPGERWPGAPSLDERGLDQVLDVLERDAAAEEEGGDPSAPGAVQVGKGRSAGGRR